MLRGGYEIWNQVKNKFRIDHMGVTADQKFSLEEVECMGSCGTAPMIAINEDFYENLSKEKVEEKKEKMEKGKEAMDENEKESMDPSKVPGTEKQLKEANKTISYLQTQLKEVNLLNAKYLFMNKLFKAKSLTESQKIKAVNAFDRATTVKEVKNTFATLNESFAVSKKKSINEGFASQAAGNAPKQSQTIESDPFISRMQVLAGINKK